MAIDLRPDLEVRGADRSSAYERIWQEFQARSWPAPHRRDWAGWAAGRGPHLLLLAPIREEAVVEAIRATQRCLVSVQGLELHPPHFFHVSIQSLGFLAPRGATPGEGEIDADTLDDLVPAIGAALARVPAVDLGLGGVNAFVSSVFLETHSRGGLRGLRATARAAGGPAVVRVDPHAAFIFHLTVGYFDGSGHASRARAAIEPLRGEAVARCWVDEVHLVAIPTDQREPYPRFEPLARFSLAGR